MPTAAVQARADMPPPSGLQAATVARVVDGDTIEVSLNGAVEDVRLIGINTPETVDPSSPVECFGPEASNRAKELLTGATVYLEADASQDERDRYDRLLRYVWLPDGTLVNLQLVREGYAFEYTYTTPYHYQAEFQRAQGEADTQDVGLWSPATCNGQTTVVQEPVEEPPPAAVVPPPAAPAEPAPGGSCDPSYPGVCIPPKSVAGDLDCGDIAFGRFQVLPPDPHGFDGNDNDGLGCESN
jgi:micrococcal nuclease